MFGLLLSLAGNAFTRIGVPGHTCPFIGRQPCDPASLISMAFHPTVVWLAFNFFVERPMARRRATSSPAWGGVSVMALLRFPFSETAASLRADLQQMVRCFCAYLPDNQ
jgi:hypothetical protein